MEHTGHARPNGKPHDFVSGYEPVESHGAPWNLTFLRAQLVY